jgi:hypothetical protein
MTEFYKQRAERFPNIQGKIRKLLIWVKRLWA